jgi:DNA polymerase (family 10)
MVIYYKKGKYMSSKKPKIVRKLAQTVKRNITRYSKRVAVAGSIRRGVGKPVDIDIVTIPKSAEAKEKIIQYLKQKGRLIQKGPHKVSSRIQGVKTEVVFTQPKSWGASLMTYTGPYYANIANRTLAKSKHMLLNQYGLFKKLDHQTGRQIAGRTEGGIYHALGKTYREPEERGKPRK